MGEGEGGVGIRLPICGGGVTTGLPYMFTFVHVLEYMVTIAGR